MMDFIDTQALLDFGIGKRRVRMTSQDYNHGKVVSSQSINQGRSPLMTVYADLVALLRWLTAFCASVAARAPRHSLHSPSTVRDIASVFNPQPPCNCMPFAARAQSQHDCTKIRVVALFLLQTTGRAAFWIAAVRQMPSVRYRLLVGQRPPFDSKCSMCA